MFDLLVKRGQSRRLDPAAYGWLEVHGEVVCGGELKCLGIQIEPGAKVQCQRLVSNVVCVNNIEGTVRVDTTEIRAIGVWLIGVISSPEWGAGSLGALIDARGVHAEYLHHDPGDLNPGFAYARGSSRILPSARDPNLRSLRSDLTNGVNPFTGVEPLVVKPMARPAMPVDPVLEALRAWVATHPGPQRQVLNDLRSEWVARLAGIPGAANEIRSAIRSPKLVAERDALLATLK